MKEGKLIAGEAGVLSNCLCTFCDLRLVPNFNENDPATLFFSFWTRNWPESAYVLMLQYLLTWRAQEAYAPENVVADALSRA